MSFRLFYSDKCKSGLNLRGLVLKCCKAALKETGYKNAAEVSVTVVNDGEIRGLNKQYRGIDKSTDVLSFPLGDPDPDTGAVNLGDIIISAETALRQAEAYGHGVPREAAFLTVHGMLHLLGFDHAGEKAAEEMFARQEEILQKLKINRD